ncbi:MAG: acyltransferase, partial [Desulfatitalea sp.]|nr:acyltransferase [Desulfatitalea sp.]NNJ99366.1 acyltransferase [Desulfatitalea sp.]
MHGRTIILQAVNQLFGLMPLTRWYKYRAAMLRFAGIDCALSARVVSSARIVTTNLSIGHDTFVGHQVLIAGNFQAKIIIGSFVDIAPRAVVLSGTHQIDMFSEHSAGEGHGGEVFIENGVWIGSNATVLPGVTIGSKTIVGAGSVVSKNLPPYC